MDWAMNDRYDMKENQSNHTFMRCAPSAVFDAPEGAIKPLLLACTIIEFGLLTEAEA